MQDCPVCSGPATQLGTLAELVWFRCRDCGLEFNHKRDAMTFNEQVDTWFDKLAEEQLTDRCRSEFRDVLASAPNRENLRRLRDAADTLSADASIPLVAHIDAITGDQFTGEFLLTYSEQSGEVSAASELFSLVRQALNYEEHP